MLTPVAFKSFAVSFLSYHWTSFHPTSIVLAWYTEEFPSRLRLTLLSRISSATSSIVSEGPSFQSLLNIITFGFPVHRPHIYMSTDHIGATPWLSRLPLVVGCGGSQKKTSKLSPRVYRKPGAVCPLFSSHWQVI